MSLIWINAQPQREVRYAAPWTVTWRDGSERSYVVSVTPAQGTFHVDKSTAPEAV
jgi:hypothetical protein